jgi:Ca2+/H+ antiporter
MLLSFLAGGLRHREQSFNAQAAGVHANSLVLAVIATRVAMMRLIRAATTGLAELRVAAFSHLHDLSVLHVQSERRGALVSRVTSDIDAIMHYHRAAVIADFRHSKAER